MSEAAVRERWAMSVEAKALFLITAILLAFGFAVLYSAVSTVTIKGNSISGSTMQKQLVGVLFGIVLLAVAAKYDAEKWTKHAWPLVGISSFLLLLIVLPFTPNSIAPKLYGAHRWLKVPSVGQVQPSELAKFAVIVWTSMLIVKKGAMLRHLFKGITPFLIVVGFIALLAAVEPDISVGLTLLFIMGVILFASGARIGHFLFLGAVGLPCLIVLAQSSLMPSYVNDRLNSVLHGGNDGPSTQLLQSMRAVGSGGLFGQGYGQGMGQSGWVTFGYNDFIGSVVGEEFGFIGLLFVIAAFALYGYLGFRIAAHARTRFQELLAIGITFTMLFTAFVHIGVVIGVLPTTGLTLPFFSSGVSNLLVSFVMTGILINIGSTRERVYGSVPETAQAVQVASTA